LVGRDGVRSGKVSEGGQRSSSWISLSLLVGSWQALAGSTGLSQLIDYIILYLHVLL